MSLIVVGYDWCNYYQDTCKWLDSGGHSFLQVLCENRVDLKSRCREICRHCPVLGVAGATSPQIFRRDTDRIICLGGHDDLMEIGVSNVLTWLPLKF
jgi:hypothetical protein